MTRRSALAKVKPPRLLAMDYYAVMYHESNDYEGNAHSCTVAEIGIP